MRHSIFLIGFGKIVIGLLSLRMLNHLKPDTVFIVGVRRTASWSARRENHSTLTSRVYDYYDELLSETEWEMSREEESFMDFCERCHSGNRPGIWLYSDLPELSEAIEVATVIATSVGVEGLNEVLKAISQLSTNKSIFAFENQPTALQSLAQNYPNISLVPCPIDRVVVKREFDDAKGEVCVKHGFDSSELIMIYDKEDTWKNLLQNLEKTSITIVDDATLLSRALKKKMITKNAVHKYVCQLTIYKGGYNFQDIRTQPLCQLLKDEWTAHIKSFKPAIVAAAVIDTLSLWPTYTPEFCQEMYTEFSAYFDISMNTVMTDPSDTIGRLVHLATAETAIQDSNRLIAIFNSLKKVLETEASTDVFCALSKMGVNLTVKEAVEKINEIITITECNIKNTK